MSRLPFSVYDFFGYLSAGFALVAAGDYTFDRGWVLRDDLSLAAGLFWIIAAYITGHIVANIAGFVLEAQAIRRWLGPPEDLLFRDRGPAGWRRAFPGYFRTLPPMTRARVLDRARDRAGITGPGRDLFFHCHPIVLRSTVTRERLDHFLNLYGFCRNTCLALMAATVIFAVALAAHRWSETPIGAEVEWAAVAAPVAAVGLFYRYLKFYREYTVEVFRTYAEVESCP